MAGREGLNRSIWRAAGWLMSWVFAAPILAAAPAEPFASVVQPLLRQSCAACHGQVGAVSGNLSLAGLRSANDLMLQPELLQRMVKALETGFMPPKGAPPLDPGARESAVHELRSLLHAAAASRRVLPRTPIRRMNRFQYANAVQDLFDLDREVFALPERMVRDYGYFQPESGRLPDQLKAGSRPLGKSQLIGQRLAGVAPFPQDLRAEHGFDNRGDHLTLSPLLLESFLKLAKSILESDDFNAETSGAWKGLFEPSSEDLRAEAARVLRQFLTTAFRRPVDEETLARYVGRVTARMAAGDSYSQAMAAAYSAALASPRFLYLYDLAGASNAEPAHGFELASRLSFFLWGSIPDRELLDLAAGGRLQDPGVLSGQVDRMLRDVRVKRFCDSFPAQWLQLERIVSSVPDPELFPDFYFAKFRASMHMMLEPLLLFEAMLVENRPILDLIDSDFSYRSELLESWYRDGSRPAKVPPVAIPFRRVRVADRRQGGVITTAAVMTMTSAPAETKPITRGAWLASVIFNDPPDPPPADVPPLPAREQDAGPRVPLTLRERLEAHRTQPDCVSCHARIDPLGFALENYGPTGVWRDRYENGREVDASGVLFGRRDFEDAVGFKDAILAEKEVFARAFAEHLLAFALGREVHFSDEPALDRIVRETAPDGFRIREMLRQTVLSEPFRRKYSPAAPAEPG